MYGDTRKYMTEIFSGQTPVRRTNPKMGESEYYYFKPNQDGWSSLSEVETVDVPSKDTPNPYLQNQTDTFGQSTQFAQNNVQMNDGGIVNGENPQAQFDIIRGKDMGNGWETTPDFSYLNNSPLHMGLTASEYKDQARLKSLDTSAMEDRKILDTPYSSNILVNDCLQSERFYPFSLRVRWNEGENQGITFATKENNGTDQNTKYGIAQKTYNTYKGKYQNLDPSYPDEVKNLTEEQGMNILCQEYYKPSRVEAINDANTAFAVYDLAVNHYNDGPEAWQRTLRDYAHPNLQVGGGIGSATLNALNKTVLPSSFKQDLIKNRLEKITPKYRQGLYNRMNTYNIGNKF